MAGVVVTLDDDVFAELQRRATPLVDDANSVIRRLLASVPDQNAEARAPRFVALSRGERLPVGLRLRMIVAGRTFEATVTAAGIEFQGRSYRSPSGAARAVLLSTGASEEAAHTNGWDAWEYFDEVRQVFVSLRELRTDRPDLAQRKRPFQSLGSGSSGLGNLARLSTTQPIELRWP